MQQEVADSDLEQWQGLMKALIIMSPLRKHACGKWDNCKRSVPLASQLVASYLHVHAQAGRRSVVCNLTGCFTERSSLIYLCVCFYNQFPAFHWEFFFEK